MASYVVAMVSNEKSPGGLSGCGNSEPVETWMASAPSLSHHFATSMVSASMLPLLLPRNDVVVVDRAELDLQMEIVADLARGSPGSLRAGSARDFRSEPPYSSVRSLMPEREELGEQVAVRRMQLDAVEAGLARAPGAGGERFDELLDLGLAVMARQRNPCSDSLRLVELSAGRWELCTPGRSICRPEWLSCMMYLQSNRCTASPSCFHSGMKSSRCTVA